MNTQDRRLQVRELLRHSRARLRPQDVGLPPRAGRRRVPGLRAGEVAELVGVSTAWYEALEFGATPRRFSAAFVQRVADVLRLSDTDRATLLRLTLPEVAHAADIYERSTNDGALCFLSCARKFVGDLTSVSSFEDAAMAAVETGQRIVGATCMTIAALERPDCEPLVFAAGPKAKLAGEAFARSAIDANAPTRTRAAVMCENAPHPSDVEEGARHPVRIQPSTGDEILGFHDPDIEEYRNYNGLLLERSSSAIGLFERQAFRGNLVYSWSEPRLHPSIEIEVLRTLSALLELASAPSA